MLVEYTCSDRVATLTLNRPEKLNAFNDELVMALQDGLRRFDADPEAQVAIIHGRGRAFSSGADVQQRQLRKREEFERLGGPQGFGAHSCDLLTKSVNWKPVIAAPHGYVLGLAVGIVLESDLIVAEAGTKFQITETPRGLGGAKYWGMMHFRGAGAFGTEVALTGRFFTAEEALAAGVINRVAPAGTYLDAARALANGGHLVLIVGDGWVPSGVVDAAAPSVAAARRAGLELIAGASLERPDSGGREQLREHVFAFRKV